MIAQSALNLQRNGLQTPANGRARSLTAHCRQDALQGGVGWLRRIGQQFLIAAIAYGDSRGVNRGREGCFRAVLGIGGYNGFGKNKGLF